MKKHLLLSFAVLLSVLFASAAFCADSGPEDGSREYIFPDADTRFLTDDELLLLSPQVLCYGKNEIYARRGRRFVSAELTEYFSSTSWYMGMYSPEQFRDSFFNEYEYANIMLIDNLQQYNPEYQYVLDQPGYNFDAIDSYFTDEDEETVYRSREAAYYSVLQKYAEQIRAYDWQYMGEEALDPPSNVAVCDITADGQPELFYMSRPTDYAIGYLTVWGYEDGHLIRMLQKGFDFAAGGGCRYTVFQTDEKGGLSIYTSSGDEIWTDELSEYHAGSDGRLYLAGVLTHTSVPTGDYAYYLKQTYLLNGRESDADTYRQILDYVWETRGYDLIGSWYGDSLGELSSLPLPASMTLDDALDFFRSGIPDDDTHPELEAYSDYIAHYIDLFTEQNEHFGYCLLDVDADDTYEIFILYPSGNRYALRAYTFDGGWVKSIISNDEGGVIYGVGGIHRTDAGVGVVVSFFSGASMTDYVFCYKNGDSLEVLFTLSRNDETGRQLLDDTAVSDEVFQEYLDTFDPEPMAVTDYR